MPRNTEQMTKDWNGYFANSKPGDVQDWVGGTLKRGNDGAAIYTRTGSNNPVVFNKTTSMDELARNNADIAADWNKNYGELTPTNQPPPRTPPPQQNPSQPTPIATDLASGNLTTDKTGAYYTPPGGVLVEDRMKGLLASESPYLKAVRENAKQEMNSRGLLHSTMAGTAGEKAAIEAALPIAQQDADYYQTLGTQANQGAITSSLSKQDFEQQSKQYMLQGDITQAINAKTQQYQKELAAMGYDNQKVMKDMDIAFGKLEIASKADLAAQDRASQEKRTAQELASQEKRATSGLTSQQKIEADRLASVNKEMFNNSVNKLSDDFMNDYLEITINPNFATPIDRQKALDLLTSNTKLSYGLISSIAGYELTWEPPESNAFVSADKSYAKGVKAAGGLWGYAGQITGKINAGTKLTASEREYFDLYRGQGYFPNTAEPI